MIFLDSAHQAFFEQAVIAEQAENDLSRKALFYTLGLTEATRAHINELYNFHSHIIKDVGLRARWQTKVTRKVCNLAFNLYNGYTGRNGLYAVDYTPWRLFDTSLRPYMFQAVEIRYPNDQITEEESQ